MVNGVTSLILIKQLAWFGMNFSSRRGLTVRSLCGMQTTGDPGERVNDKPLGPPDAWRMSPTPGPSVLRSGVPELNCRFQAYAPARGVVVR